jgi:hypothetical protein
LFRKGKILSGKKRKNQENKMFCAVGRVFMPADLKKRGRFGKNFAILY